MSYILDALRRAEAERERGAVPGIHAQQYTQLPADDEPRQRTRVLWAAGALALFAIAVLVWTLLIRDRPAAAPDPALASAPAPTSVGGVAVPTVPPATGLAAPSNGSTTVAPPVAPEARRPAARPATERAASSAALAMAPRSEPVPARSAPAPATVPPRSTAPTAAPTPVPVLPAPATAARATPGALPGTAREAGTGPIAALPATPAAPVAPRSEATAPRIYTQAELPDDIRAQLPRVSVGGSAYSNDPASRMVMVNGQIYHEGDTLAPNLVLERIRPRGAVLAFRGYRYEIAY